MKSSARAWKTRRITWRVWHAAAKPVAAHAGRIGVESEVGRGTKFTIELPIPPRLAGE